MKKTLAFLGCILFVLILCGTYIFVSHSPKFNLTGIDIQGNHKVSEKEILEKAPMKLGTNIFRVNLRKVEDHLRGDNRIKEVQVKRALPDRIVIEVEEKKPALWINLPEGLFGLSQDQEIIPLNEEELVHDLPIVTGLSSSSIFDYENRRVKSYQRWPETKAKLALDFYKSLLEEDSSLTEIISEISLDEEGNLVLYLIPLGTQVNMGKGGFKKKVQRLKAILPHEEKGKNLACIDLRFKDLVVLVRSSAGSDQPDSQVSNSQLAQMRRADFGGKEGL